jgi:hypothetical protein
VEVRKFKDVLEDTWFPVITSYTVITRILDFMLFYYGRCRGSSVSMTRQWTRPGFSSRQGAVIFPLLRDPHTILSSGYLGSFSGVKRPGNEADHWPSSRAEVEDAWGHTFSPYVFVAWCLVKYRDNLTCLWNGYKTWEELCNLRRDYVSTTDWEETSFLLLSFLPPVNLLPAVSLHLSMGVLKNVCAKYYGHHNHLTSGRWTWS